MPLIDISPRVFNPAVDGRKGFGVFLFREFGNRVIKLRFGHTVNLRLPFRRWADWLTRTLEKAPRLEAN